MVAYSVLSVVARYKLPTLYCWCGLADSRIILKSGQDGGPLFCRPGCLILPTGLLGPLTTTRAPRPPAVRRYYPPALPAAATRSPCSSPPIPKDKPIYSGQPTFRN